MITVVTIAKNEEDRIERMIKSAHQLTDQVVVVDTGSKDDTADVARNAGAAVLHDPWVDFGHNLTRAIMWASEGTDWILRMDADMVISALHPNFADWLHNDATADAYNVTLTESGTAWRLPLLMTAHKQWRYVGPTHEYLEDKGRKLADVNGITIQHLADGSNRSTKFERDIELLYEGVEAGEPRAIFYTAESYRCLGHFQEAFDMFLKRAQMQGTWEEERWYAYYRAGCCLLEIDPHRGAAILLDAHRMRPSRSEPLMRLQEWCAKTRIQEVGSDRLFIERSAYI